MFAFFIQPTCFGVDPKCKDNALVLTKNVSVAQSSTDDVQTFALLQEIQDRLQKEEIECLNIPLRAEPRPFQYLYENSGEGLFARDAVSFHYETDDEGKITRRVVVLYPLNPHRQHCLPKRHLLDRIESAIDDGAEVDLIDLRGFEEEKQYLEGNGAVVFSADSKFAYMARSNRSSERILDILCSEENLNIPKSNRFVFDTSFPAAAHSVFKTPIVTHHTDILGWCGRGICAWATECMKFATPEEGAAFEEHLIKNYDRVLHLSPAEAAAFAGNAAEVVLPNTGCPAILISLMALEALSVKNKRLLLAHYGESNVLTFYGEVIERRGGTSIASCVVLPHVRGNVLPNRHQTSTLELLEVGKDLKQ